MKAIFIAYNQAYNEEIVEALETLGQRGYTKWEEIGGRGTVDGEPHLGTMPGRLRTMLFLSPSRTNWLLRRWLFCVSLTKIIRILVFVPMSSR